MKQAVHCFFEDTSKIVLDLKSLNTWITSVIQGENLRLKSLNIVICSDIYLLDLNKQYLKHDTYTDIITFPLHEPDEPIEGELYISIDRIKENAKALKVEWQDELDRVIIHGVLHLLGYNDHTEEEKQEIRQREDYCLTLRA